MTNFAIRNIELFPIYLFEYVVNLFIYYLLSSFNFTFFEYFIMKNVFLIILMIGICYGLNCKSSNRFAANSSLKMSETPPPTDKDVGIVCNAELHHYGFKDCVLNAGNNYSCNIIWPMTQDYNFLLQLIRYKHKDIQIINAHTNFFHESSSYPDRYTPVQTSKIVFAQAFRRDFIPPKVLNRNNASLLLGKKSFFYSSDNDKEILLTVTCIKKN